MKQHIARNNIRQIDNNGDAQLIKQASIDYDLMDKLNQLLEKQDEQTQQLQNLLIMMNITNER